MNSQRLAIFSTIVQTGSISKAAVRLSCGKSVVSRQLTRLEDELGIRLVQRTTRRLTLTEAGELVYREAQQIDRALANIEQLAGQFQQQVQGRLRVACPLPLGQRYLVPILAEFTALHPQVDVVLLVEDRLVDLIAEKIDVAIRVAHLEDSSLVARKLADNPRVVVAAPTYLARAGTPRTPAELAGHDCLLFNGGGHVFDEWQFSFGPDTPPATATVRVRGTFQTNNGMALAAAAVAGAGITGLDRLLVQKELASGELVELLTDYHPRSGAPIYAVYPARDWLALKTSTFIAFLQERLFK
jgi:DNA-binding transcriptional LysR family regulator